MKIVITVEDHGRLEYTSDTDRVIEFIKNETDLDIIDVRHTYTESNKKQWKNLN